MSCCTAKNVHFDEIKVDENGIQQCFVAHIVYSCQQYCSTWLHPIEAKQYIVVDNMLCCLKLNFKISFKELQIGRNVEFTPFKIPTVITETLILETLKGYGNIFLFWLHNKNFRSDCHISC